MSTDSLWAAATLAGTNPADTAAQRLFLTVAATRPARAAAADAATVLRRVQVVDPALAAFARGHSDDAVRAAYYARTDIGADELVAAAPTARGSLIRATLLERTEAFTEAQLRTLATPLTRPVAEVLAERPSRFPADLAVAAMCVLEPATARRSVKSRVDRFAKLVLDDRYAEAAAFADGLHPEVRLAAVTALSGRRLAAAVTEVLPTLTDPALPTRLKVRDVLATLRYSRTLAGGGPAAAAAVIAYCDSLPSNPAADMTRTQWLEVARNAEPDDAEGDGGWDPVAELAEVTGAGELAALWQRAQGTADLGDFAGRVLLHRDCDPDLAARVRGTLDAEPPRPPLSEPAPAWLLADRDAFVPWLLRDPHRGALGRYRSRRLADDRVVDGVGPTERIGWVADRLATHGRQRNALWRTLLKLRAAPTRVLDLAPWAPVASALADGALAPHLAERLVQMFTDLYAAAPDAEPTLAVLLAGDAPLRDVFAAAAA